MNLQDDLKKLGDTPHEIAVSLFLKGVTGYIAEPNRCPIANYLRLCGHNPEDVGVFSICTDVRSYATPEPVADFIDLFDDGCYPKLIAQ